MPETAQLEEEVQTVTISNVPLRILEGIRRLAESEQRTVSNFMRLQLERILAEHNAKKTLLKR